LWKIEVGNLANELGLDITLPHPPPGKSKWNKSEHWQFSFIAAFVHRRKLALQAAGQPPIT
jgi:Rhodopirellula transposase DDE domain